MMYEEAMQLANDALRSIRTVASFSAEDKVMELYNKSCEEPVRAGIRQGVISGIAFVVSFRLNFLINASIFYAGARLVGSGKIAFENVYQVVAFVGESGSGKSTAIALLLRFYDPDSGHILLDGIEIQKFQLRWLRQQMGLVSQEPTLFKETIHANIAYGKEGKATEAEIIAAAELANGHRSISCLNQGYQTMVGERGIQLSDGQKQRVAIARAIVKQPKILLLDEGTSALDRESERIVQDALNHVMVNQTTVIVAHRLATRKA